LPSDRLAANDSVVFSFGVADTLHAMTHRVPVRLLCGPLCGLLGLLSSCTLSESYLVPSKAIELVHSQPPDSRQRAQLPALRESDRSAALIRYRALEWSGETLNRVAATPMTMARVRVAKVNPLMIAGGTILALSVPHLALGMAAGLDLPPGETKPADPIGMGIGLGLGGLHVFVGGLLMALGERRPNIEPTEPALVKAYLRGEIPTATAAQEAVTETGEAAPPPDPPRRSTYNVPLSPDDGK
jgi:hypothetical protein